MDELIVTMKAAGRYKSRDEPFQVWVDTYEGEELRLQAMDLCRPCTEAVLDAAVTVDRLHTGCWTMDCRVGA